MKTHPFAFDSPRRGADANGPGSHLEYQHDFRRATMADNDCTSPDPIKGSNKQMSANQLGVPSSPYPLSIGKTPSLHSRANISRVSEYPDPGSSQVHIAKDPFKTGNKHYYNMLRPTIYRKEYRKMMKRQLNNQLDAYQEQLLLRLMRKHLS